MSDPAGSIIQARGGSEKDYAAIARVIHAETSAFQREDFDAWQECWVHDDRTQDVCISATAGIAVHDGWHDIAASTKKVFDEGTSCKLLDFTQENLRIAISGIIAWVVYEGRSIFGVGGRGETFETRILERDGTDWRIVYSSFVLRQNDAPGGLTVCLDAFGQIIRSTPHSLEALKSHRFLTISAGRLRAHRREWDKALQQAIVQAGRHHGFFETHRYANEMGGPAHFPVILGQTDEGGVAVAHFSIRDCMTYVQVDGDAHLEQRLKSAQTVFGLSDGQLKVARHIAMGESLKGSAANLGISVNTARTHLSRLFEKTGVGTQAALVRLLLSVG